MRKASPIRSGGNDVQLDTLDLSPEVNQLLLLTQALTIQQCERLAALLHEGLSANGDEQTQGLDELFETEEGRKPQLRLLICVLACTALDVLAKLMRAGVTRKSEVVRD